MQYRIGAAVIMISVAVMTIVAVCCLFTEREKSRRREREREKRSAEQAAAREAAANGRFGEEECPGPGSLPWENREDAAAGAGEASLPPNMGVETGAGAPETDETGAEQKPQPGEPGPEPPASSGPELGPPTSSDPEPPASSDPGPEPPAPAWAVRPLRGAEYEALRGKVFEELDRERPDEPEDFLRRRIFEMTAEAEKAGRDLAVCSGIFIPVSLLYLLSGAFVLPEILRSAVTSFGVALLLLYIVCIVWNGHVRTKCRKMAHVMRDVLSSQKNKTAGAND